MSTRETRSSSRAKAAADAEAEADAESSASDSALSTKDMFRQLTQMMTDMRSELKADIKRIDNRLDAMERRVESRFAAIERRVDALSDDEQESSSEPLLPLQEPAADNDFQASYVPSPADEKPAMPTTSAAAAKSSRRSGVPEQDMLAKITNEYNYYLARPYTPVSHYQPSEGFVLALFPLLELRDTTLRRRTPSNLTNNRLQLPTFFGQKDPDLHLKLVELQNQLRSNHVHLNDWPPFAADSCGSTHRKIRDWAHQSRCRWHHFVLALICKNGLHHYRHARDMAFTQFSNFNSASPEATLAKICDELELAPAIHKPTSQRAMEYEAHLYRLDEGLEGLIPPFTPDGTQDSLMEWAYNGMFIAESHWQKTRSTLKTVQSTVSTTPPVADIVTSNHTASDTAVDDADAYAATEVYRVETHTGRCFNCGKSGHWSRDCKLPKKSPPTGRYQFKPQRRPALDKPTRKPAAREPSKRPLAITDRTVKIAKGTLYRMHGDNEDETNWADDEDISDRDVMEVLAEESGRDLDGLVDRVLSIEE